MKRAGLLLPHRRLDPASIVRLAVTAEEVGYGSVWAAEVSDYDAFALLAAIAMQTWRVQLGTAIVPVFTRTPALLAMSASTLNGLAPGRVVLGIGASSKGIVEDWHGRCFDQPVATVGDACHIIRQILSGAQTGYEGASQTSHSFQLSAPPSPRPRLYVAALGPAMRELAAERADGVILNFLPASKATAVASALQERSAKLEITALVRVSSGSDDSRRRLRKEFASYLRVTAYRNWLCSLGYHELVGSISPEDSPDRVADRLPDSLINDVSAVGDPDDCRARLSYLQESGVTPIVVPVPAIDDYEHLEHLVRAVAPPAR